MDGVDVDEDTPFRSECLLSATWASVHYHLLREEASLVRVE